MKLRNPFKRLQKIKSFEADEVVRSDQLEFYNYKPSGRMVGDVIILNREVATKVFKRMEKLYSEGHKHGWSRHEIQGGGSARKINEAYQDVKKLIGIVTEKKNV